MADVAIRRGRPARATVAGYPVTIRLTPDERSAYIAAAEAAAMPLAVWIRSCCDAKLPKTKRKR